MNSKERSDASSTRYPADWESIGATRDQVPYRIRPIRDDDEQRELDFIERLSPESRYNRLLVGFRTPTAEQLARWVHVDYQNQMAMVATIGSDADERIIGVARYSLDAPRHCEFAIAIADEWQRRHRI